MHRQRKVLSLLGIFNFQIVLHLFLLHLHPFKREVEALTITPLFGTSLHFKRFSCSLTTNTYPDLIS